MPAGIPICHIDQGEKGIKMYKNTIWIQTYAFIQSACPTRLQNKQVFVDPFKTSDIIINYILLTS